jgi:hypothetical protein
MLAYCGRPLESQTDFNGDVIPLQVLVRAYAHVACFREERGAGSQEKFQAEAGIRREVPVAIHTCHEVRVAEITGATTEKAASEPRGVVGVPIGCLLPVPPTAGEQIGVHVWREVKVELQIGVTTPHLLCAAVDLGSKGLRGLSEELITQAELVIGAIDSQSQRE